jgi:hypothetical protein
MATAISYQRLESLRRSAAMVGMDQSLPVEARILIALIAVYFEHQRLRVPAEAPPPVDRPQPWVLA